MSSPNARGIPPEDVEQLVERHVRKHVRNAAADLAAAMAPLRERTIYHGSPVLKAIEEAHGAAAIAAAAVERWRLRTAPQGDAFTPEPEPTAFDLDPSPEEAESMRLRRHPEDPESEA